jgi:uncharacterized protein DUF4058
MPSPFPGMNPYLEQEDVWSDFHNRFIPAAADAIGPQVSLPISSKSTRMFSCRSRTKSLTYWDGLTSL